jgi:hypothetical protein
LYIFTNTKEMLISRMEAPLFVSKPFGQVGIFPTGLQRRYVVVFSLIYALLLPAIFLAGKSLLAPLLGGAENLIMGKLPDVPFYFWIKLLAYCALGLGCLVWLRLRLELLFISTWAANTARPHPLHVDYYPVEPYSIWALGKWKLYRLLRLGTLPILVVVALFLSLVVQFWLLNLLFDTVFMRLPLLHILGIFWLFALGLLWIASMVNALWQAVGTTFGAFAASTEPLRPLPILFNRCTRLLPYSRHVGFLMLGRGLLLMAWILATGFYLWRYDLATTGALGFPYVLAMLTLLGLGMAEVLLGYAKWGMYHAALQRFYSQLPPFIQDAFSPPMSLYEDDVKDTPLHQDAPPP